MYKIALLDDDAIFCEAMHCILSHYYEVTTFTNTNAFLETMKGDDYDLVLIDLSIIPSSNITPKNGFEIIEFLKKTLKKPPLFILFTGWLRTNSLEEWKKLCPTADGFLAKDGELEDMLREINRLLASNASQH